MSGSLFLRQCLQLFNSRAKLTEDPQSFFSETNNFLSCLMQEAPYLEIRGFSVQKQKVMLCVCPCASDSGS